MTVRILRGDCLDVLRTLPADSVHCCVSSPPYYGLRDYGTAQWDGGDPACGHVAGMARNDERTIRSIDAASGRRSNAEAYASDARGAMQYRDACGKCGARRIDRQIGLEPTPDAFVATLVEVFREVRRVMRHDAVAFINLGDSYQDKQLLMMPARVALALQADGWVLRSDIIWHKPNPMPESVTDRPTSAHEHVFLLAKSPRYFWDADAVRQEPSGRTDPIVSFGHVPGNKHADGYQLDATKGANCRTVWTIATAPFSEAHFATFPPELAERCIKAGTSERGACSACGAPWVRQVERKHYGDKSGGERSLEKGFTRNAMGGQQEWDNYVAPITTGWSPSCACDAAVAPCVVLDPFGGAGTVGLVADRLQRDAVLIELNPDYAAMAERRLHSDAGMFAMVASA